MDGIRSFGAKDRVSAWWVMLVLPFRPRIAAQAASGVSLLRAYLAHFVVLILWVGPIILFVSYMNYLFSSRWGNESVLFTECLAKSVRTLFDFISVSRQALVAGAVWGVVELIFLLGSFLMLLWSAQPESLGHSIRRCVRIVWLGSLLVLGVIVVMLIATAVINSVQVLFDGSWDRWLWVNRHLESLFLYPLFATCMGWLLWALLTAGRVPTQTHCPITPPMCEWCGYNLAYTPPEGMCPECGRAAIESLGPEVRRTSPHGYWRCFFPAIARPDRFFRKVPIRSAGAESRRFVLKTLFLTMIVTYSISISLLMNRAASGHWPNADSMVDSIVICLPGFVIPMLVIGGVGSFVGLCFSWADRRNQMSAVAHVSYWTSGYVLIWWVLALLMVAFLTAWERELADLSRMWMRNADALVILLLLAFHIPCFVVYVHLLDHSVRSIRYANR